MNNHFEIIECPNCGKIQQAIVEHSEPFFTYIHHCVKCDYIIMESEWNKLPDPIHLYPINDLREHYLESVDARLDGFGEEVAPYCSCLCSPKATRQENGVWIIKHNSFDGREGLEWASEILNEQE